MKAFLFKLSIYLVLFLLIVNLLAYGSLYVLKKSSFYKPSFLVNNFDQKEDLDYIILGSSRGLTTINSKQIDSELETNGINLSMDDTGLGTHFLMLQHFFESHYSSKICILNLDLGSAKRSIITLGDNDYRFTPFVDRDYVSNYFKNIDGRFLKILAYSKYLPFLAVSYYNFELFFPSLFTLNNLKKRHHFDSRGNFQYPKSSMPIIEDRESSDFILLELNNPYLSKIKDICERNDCHLIYYIAPIYSHGIESDLNGNKLINHSNLLVDKKLFYDNIHVNSRGRYLSTNELISFFKRNSFALNLNIPALHTSSKHSSIESQSIPLVD